MLCMNVTTCRKLALETGGMFCHLDALHECGYIEGNWRWRQVGCCVTLMFSMSMATGHTGNWHGNRWGVCHLDAMYECGYM